MLDLDYMNESVREYDADISPRSVLVVDDMVDNIEILRGILSRHYHVRIAKNGEQALAQVAKRSPDLILLDIMMPGMNGFEVCRAIKSNPITAHIPVIFITAMTSIEDEKLGFEVGGTDFITKPITPLTTLSRVQNQIRLADQYHRNELLIAQRTKQLEESLNSAVEMLSVVSHYKDDDTAVHMGRMADYCALIAAELGWLPEECDRLKMAAPLHDIGKLGIPDTILKAPRALDEAEWQVMQQHTEIGYEILSRSQSPLFQMAANIAVGHHERWDGTGYPKGLSGESIPLAARIVTLADVFDALTSERPYKKAWTLEATFDYLQKESGRIFDPVLVSQFIKSVDKIKAIKDAWEKV